MLSKNKIKLVGQLSNKKFRYENSLFLAEGHKCVNELLKSFECVFLAHTEGYELPDGVRKPKDIETVTSQELKQVSLLETPQNVLAIFRIKPNAGNGVKLEGKLTIAIDGVQDAGNMGTIVRIADWFGVEDIVCSFGTVDVYNPKCVQATMGALARVNVRYTDLAEFLKSASEKVSVYTTTLDGSNIYESKLDNNAVVVFGNEGNGISREVRSLCNRSLIIPSFPKERVTSESLNVGVAAAIVIGEFRRQFK
ncbi:MAG: RNA methyltransferase [Paludibacteraceae bacterium]|nr:RNA methyltransferase [Paludibacteraceae bacterium]